MYHNVLHVFHDVLQCFMMFSESRNNRRCRTGIRAAADRLRDRDNSAAIGDSNKLVIVYRDRLYRRERDPMLNSILNGDWSNSVPGRKIPEGIGYILVNIEFAKFAEIKISLVVNRGSGTKRPGG